MIDQPEFFTYVFSVGLELIFYITMLFFTIYTMLLVYHWVAYSVKKSTALVASAVFLTVSAPLFLIMAIML